MGKWEKLKDVLKEREIEFRKTKELVGFAVIVFALAEMKRLDDEEYCEALRQAGY